MKYILFVLLQITLSLNPSEAEVTHRVKLTVKVGDEVLPEKIVIGLFGDETPKTVENFYKICTEGVQHNEKTISFDDSVFHRVIPGFMI